MPRSSSKARQWRSTPRGNFQTSPFVAAADAPYAHDDDVLGDGTSASGGDGDVPSPCARGASSAPPFLLCTRLPYIVLVNFYVFKVWWKINKNSKVSFEKREKISKD